MRLHANAALSWSGRRLLCDRVLGQGWTVTAAAEAAGVRLTRALLRGDVATRSSSRLRPHGQRRRADHANQTGGTRQTLDRPTRFQQ